MNSRRVTVLGASSQIGVFALPLLAARGFEVLALSRNGQPDWYPALAGVEWRKTVEDESPKSAPSRYMLSAGPLAVAAKLVIKRNEYQRVVAFSTTSVLSKADSAEPREQHIAGCIADAEARLRKSCLAGGNTLYLFRPTLVYGCGMDRNISLIARWIERWGFVPLSRLAQGRRQPVHAEDLARLAVSALASKDARTLESPLCGGSTLDYRTMVERIFEALQKPPRFVTLPHGVLTAAARLARWLQVAPGVEPEMVHRQRLDLVFDDAPARASLGWQPRRFQPGRADFLPPDAQRLQRLAASVDG